MFDTLLILLYPPTISFGRGMALTEEEEKRSEDAERMLKMRDDWRQRTVSGILSPAAASGFDIPLCGGGGWLWGNGRLRLSSVLIFFPFSLCAVFFERRVVEGGVFFCLREYRLKDCVRMCLPDFGRVVKEQKYPPRGRHLPPLTSPRGCFNRELKFLEGTGEEY
ncbi:hypothetical protein AVEN_217004-1 [Araneus ventricosus]|uniref:Uncharacterized protein n=1 Tax=Araneus ventricosus TaxID=182803 RepID=A0A4Y2MUQ8_ARAVE|nr:hypothetical protein AVEN_217004-1 [Araneus ventricosus]